MNQKKWAEMHKGSTQTRPRPLWKTCLAGFGLLGLALATTLVVLKKAQALPTHRKPDLKTWTGRYAQLPLSFEVNRGQTNSRVKYLAQGLGYTLFLTSHEAVVALHRGKYGRSAGHTASASADLYLQLLGSSPAVRVTGENQLKGYSNYFIGNNPRDWHTNVANYARVRYHQIYPGIDLVYYGRRGQLENDFLLSPGANPQAIRIGLKGVKSMHVDSAGDLVLKVSGGEVYLRQPHAYQGRGKGRRDVAVHYVLRAGNQVGFAVGSYNHHQKLTIDPVLAYSTYLGGSGGDIGYGIAVDSAGDVYITGIALSTNFPTSSGAYQTANAGNGDAFVAKIDPAGSPTSTTTPQLVYSTYLGGTGSDSGNAIAVNAGGDAFITGSTSSADFPVTSGVFQTAYAGSGDAFVTELNSTGSKLNYSSFLGGSEEDAGFGIALDSSNDAYITGSTQSPDLKTTANAWQSSNAGSSDAFVAEVNFSGTQLLYLSYLGGSQADVGDSIALDGSGNVYVTGYTFSSNFPIQSPLQGANDGTVNAFVSEISIGSSSSSLKFSTYFGGSTDDRAYGLALGSKGNIYITGASNSPNFPTSVGAFQLTNHGGSDAFVAKINPSGPTLVYSTLLGGSGKDQGNGIAVDSSGDAYVTGFTNSSDFPTQNPIQAVLGISGGSACGASACSDAFLTEVNPTGTGLIQSTYLGGSDADYGQAIALGSSGTAYITGSTSSTNFPAIAGTYPAYSSSLTGVAGNAFVAEISPANSPGLAINPASLDFGNVTENVRSAVKKVQVTNEGTAALTISKITFTETDSSGDTSDFAESDNCVGTIPASGGTCTINITFTPGTLTLETGYFSVYDNATGSPQDINVQGTGVTAATAVTVSPSSLSFGNVTVGDVSSAKTVTITNTGTSTLNITGITASSGYSQTNTCSSLQNVLNIGQSCSVSVTFSPTVSGAVTGTLTIADNAEGSPQGVSLTGTGLAVFKMSSPTPNVNVLIGNTTTTAKVTASAPSSFTGSITLSCPASLSCTFSPTSIFAGQTSTMTISNLTTSMVNPFAFSVTGTSGSQSATVNMNLLFADYSLSASPALNTIVSGSRAAYTISLTPINGFNKQVELACGKGMPPGATCTFSSSSVTPSGSSANVKLTIQTTKTSMIPPPPTIPPGSGPPLILCVFALIVFIVWMIVRKRNLLPNLEGRRWLQLQVGMLCLLLLSAVFLGSCRSKPTSSSGTTTGNYSITINGTLASNSSVVRSTVINLAVTPNP